MVSTFKQEMCSYCKNTKCSKSLIIVKEPNCKCYKCNEYCKDETKIIPYEKPLQVTAKRTYVTEYER